MRPLKLKISAFKSYGGKEEIDFEKLGNDGIYLITGKTGAGKTTIFDAISFALFGSPSGKIDEVSTLRSKYAQEDIPTFVELTFSYKNKIYYIKRNPSYERKSKRGKFETVTEASKVEFHLPNGKILTKKNEVNEKIKDILGVNEIQFRQICMIAQGAFAKFLFAKTPEKESIFREIFKTANYETLEKKMKEKYKKVEDEDKLLTEQIKSFKERVECSKDFESDFFEENKKNIDFSEFLNELILFQEEKNKKLKSGIEDIETNKKIVEKNLDIAKEIEIKKEKLEELKKEKSEEEINFENYKKNLEKHANEENKIYELNTRKEIIKNDLEKYSELKNLEDEKSDLEKLVFEKENKKDDLKNQIELESKKLEILKEKKESLEKSSRNIFKLESQLKELKNQIEKLEELKKLFEDYCEKKENKKNYEAEVGNLEKISNEILDKIEKNNEILKNKEEEFTNFETIEKNFADFSLKKNKISNDLKNLENLKTLNSEIAKTSIEYNLKLKEFKESQESYEGQNKISRNLRKIYNSNQAGFLAKTLIENKPCPVCGSKIHPSPACTSQIENITLKEVEEEEKKSKEIFLKMNELSANCGEILKEIEVKKKNLQKNLRDFFEIENLEKEKIGEWIVNKFSFLKDEMKKIDDLIEKEKDREKEKENCKKEIKLLKEELEKLNSSQKLNLEKKTKANSFKVEADTNFKNVVLEIEKRTKKNFEFETEKIELLKREKVLLKEKEELQNFIKIEEQNNLELKNLKEEIPKKEKEIENKKSNVIELEKEMTSLETDLKNCKKDIEKIKNNLEFENEEFAKDKILEFENEIFKIRKKIKDEKAQFDELDKKLALQEKEIFDLKKEIEKNKDFNIDFLLQEFETLKNKLKSQTEVFQQNNSKLSINQKILSEYEEKLGQLKEAQRKNTLLKALLDTIQGKISGKDKIRLETYVHIKYFEKILFKANKRFFAMSDGKYELKRSKSSFGNSKVGLNLDIFDYRNGTVRGAATLSGGESFLASLSLALGFSDVVQEMSGGIQLETLFIDEGFGTLDEATLEQAMSALKSLSTDKKLIGIISHVNELKEEIDKQIIITKDTAGISHTAINIL